MYKYPRVIITETTTTTTRGITDETTRGITDDIHYDDIHYDDFNLRLMDSYLIYNKKIYKPWYSYPNLLELNFLYTVISAYILIDDENGEINRPRHNSFGFAKWMTNFYKLGVPQVTFMDINMLKSDIFINNISNNILLSSNNYPRIIVPFDIIDLETYYYKNIINDLYQIWGTKTSQKLCYIWMEKIHFLRRVSMQNPFKSTYFFWIDIGVFREFDHKEIANYPQLTRINGPKFWPNIEKLSYLNNDKIWLLQVDQIQKSMKSQLCKELFQELDKNKLSRYQKNFLGGTYIGGTKKAILRFDSLLTMWFHDGIRFSVENKYKSMACVDQNIWTDLFCHYPNIVSIIRPPTNKYTKSALWSSYLWFFQTNYSIHDWSVE